MKEPPKNAIIIQGHVYELRPADTAPCAHCALEYLCSDYGYLEGIPLCGIHGGDNDMYDMMRYVEVEPSTTN